MYFILKFLNLHISFIYYSYLLYNKFLNDFSCVLLYKSFVAGFFPNLYLIIHQKIQYKNIKKNVSKIYYIINSCSK